MSGQDEDLEFIMENEVSSRIQELRRGLGMTIDQLAETTGYKSATLQAALGGRARWRVGHLARLAIALGVTPGQLLPDQPAPAPSSYPSLNAAVSAGDVRGALVALAEALPSSADAGADPHEMEMLRAMRARDASQMMILLAAFMKKWGLE